MAEIRKPASPVKPYAKATYSDGYDDGYETGFRDGLTYITDNHKQSGNPAREDSTMTSSSHLVPGFKHVAVATDLPCPSCKRPFSPHSMIVIGAAINLRCSSCHRDAFTCEQYIDDDDED